MTRGKRLWRFSPIIAFAALITQHHALGMEVDVSLKELKQVNLLQLTPESLVKEVSQRNANVIYEQLQWQLSQRQVDIEKAIFEPEFLASLMHQEMDVPNSVEESLSRSFQSQYQEDSVRFSTGVKGKLDIGAQWSVSYNTNSKQSSVIDQFSSYDHEYRNTLQLAFRQPLLRDRGQSINRAKIHVAEFAQEIAFLTYRMRVMEISGRAIQAYWDYYREQEVLKTWQESLNIAEKLLQDSQARANRGLSAQTEVLEAETAVAVLTASVLNAEADLTEAANRILSLLNVTAEANPDLRLMAVAKPQEQKIDVPVFADSLTSALRNWPPYLTAQQKVGSEQVQVDYSKNQTQPRLDLALGYDLVGMSSDKRDAVDNSFSNDSNSWHVGLEFSMPILGNRSAKGALAQANIRARQAALELNAVRKNLSNSLHSKHARVLRAEDQLVYHRRDVQLKRLLRDAELEKVERGKSSIRELFRQEEDLIDYQRRYLQAVVDLKLAEAALDIAEGDLLEKYHIQLLREAPEADIGINIENNAPAPVDHTAQLK